MDPKRLFGFTALFIFIFLFLSTASSGAVQYQAIDLGDYGGISVDFEINNSGAVIGPATLRPAYSPCIWYPDGSRLDLGSIWPEGDTTAHTINDAGEVALYVHAQVYKWSMATGPVYLGTLPTAWKSCPESMNNLGDVVGWAYPPDDDMHGVLWRADGSILDLGVGCALDINNRSQTVGVSKYDGRNQWGVMWNPDGTIATVIGDVVPKGINDSGQVTGVQWDDNADRQRAFLWSETTGILSLPLLQGAVQDRFVSNASGINKHGQMVGYSIDSLGRRRPVLWDGPTSVMDLQPLPGYPHGQAFAINDRGWIVGDSSTSINTAPIEHRLTLWKPVPEPSSLLASGSGLVAVGLPWLRRRRR